MLAVCFRYVNDYDAAHDLMQEGFIKVFQNLESYRAESPLKAWIRKIMVNTCLVYLRKEKRFIKVDLEDVRESIENPFVIHDHLEFNLIMKSISRLPINMRTVLNLFAIDGYSYTEIANQLQLEEASVRSQISRARKQLLELLKETDKVIS